MVGAEDGAERGSGDGAERGSGAAAPSRSWGRAVGVGLALVVTVAADQELKAIVRSRLEWRRPLVFLGGAVRLEYAENRGAFLSLGESLPESVRFTLFVLLVGTALAAAIFFALRARSLPRPELTALALMAGGGIGNLIDRVAHGGAVVDYMSIGWGPLRTGIFNLADAAITAGALLFIWANLRHSGDVPDSSPS